MLRSQVTWARVSKGTSILEEATSARSIQGVVVFRPRLLQMIEAKKDYQPGP